MLGRYWTVHSEHAGRDAEHARKHVRTYASKLASCHVFRTNCTRKLVSDTAVSVTDLNRWAPEQPRPLGSTSLMSLVTSISFPDNENVFYRPLAASSATQKNAIVEISADTYARRQQTNVNMPTAFTPRDFGQHQ
eukprot:1329910-Rhodomonas_salina.4